MTFTVGREIIELEMLTQKGELEKSELEKSELAKSELEKAKLEISLTIIKWN